MKAQQNLFKAFAPIPGQDRRSDRVFDHLKIALKKLRVSQPLNRIATSSVRTALRVAGLQSKAVVTHLHRVGMVQSRLPNGRTLRLWSRADDWVSNQVYWRGWEGYEPESVPLFFRLATTARVTLDVGSYVGFYTLLAAHANPEGRVYAFEPLPDAFDRLKRNVALNKLSNVIPVATAVGDVNGTAEFFSTPTDLPCSSSLSYDFMRTADRLCSFSVPVLTLDRFVRDNEVNGIDLVKMDTESTEPQVLRGMMETIRRNQPIIFCEVLMGRGSEELVQEVIDSIGYKAYLLTPHGPVLRDRIEGHPVWLNYLLTTLGRTEVATL